MTSCAADILNLLRTAAAGWAGLVVGLFLVLWPWQRSREARAAANVWGGAAKGFRYERITGFVVIVLSLITLAAD